MCRSRLLAAGLFFLAPPLLFALAAVSKTGRPLRIVVKGAAARECIFPKLPEFEVSLLNVDPAKKPVSIQYFGDYRSGRQARWRFDVRDTQGRRLPVKGPPSNDGGGLSRRGPLNFGQSWDTVLEMSKYIDLEPGDYVLHIQYHDTATIADMESTGALDVLQSDGIRLHVQPRVIDLARKEKDEARLSVAALDGKMPLRILVGSYGSEAHDFIKPDSPAGRVLALRWKAVPALLEALADDKLTPEKRGWILSLLFSITGRQDPRWPNGVLIRYQWREEGWRLAGGLDGKQTSAGFGFGGTGWSWGWGDIDVARQREFAKQWRAFQDHIVVRER